MVKQKEVVIMSEKGKSCPVCGCKKNYKNIFSHCAKFGCTRHWLFHKGNKE